MSDDVVSFGLDGEFQGFFKDMRGKRRMVLKAGGEEIFLRVPKALRKAVEGEVKRGDAVTVTGRDTLDENGKQRRVVLRVQQAAGGPCVTCPILVCAKKNCWRNGGKELWRALERKIEEEGLQDLVQLRAVDCLDRCKQGPNADWAGHEFSRCRPADAERIIEKAAGALH